MKKHFIMAGILATSIIQPATAVTKCVALNSTNTECWEPSAPSNGSEWWAKCSTNGITTTTIRGIGVCSSTPNPSGNPVTSIQYSTNPSENKECWCRMISPAVSQWVHYDNPNTSAEYCARMCSIVCSKHLPISRDYRGSFFESMTD